MLKYAIALISLSLAILTVPYEWITISSDVISVLLPQGKQWASEAPALLSENELSLYNGEDNSKGLYLAILGQVFNVDKGRKHYGPGGGYRFFSGKDASRAFVTGDFTEAGLTDDVSDLSPSQVVALYDWLAFYQRDYAPIGRLIGHFYSARGQPTEALRQVEASLAEGLKLKAQAQAEKEHYPACNSEWSADRGGRVWCSTKSGGVSRDWAGVPRMLFSPGSGHSRCVCAQLEDHTHSDGPNRHMHSGNPNLQEYEGCPPLAGSCPVREED